MSKATSSGTRSLPKFGEWDVNNPSSGEGFTVIFNTARDQKKNDKNNNTGGAPPPKNQDMRGNQQKQNNQENLVKKWLSCFVRK